ncbi:MAG: NAD-dependent epimerase/dehydratase family protein [Bdellovibrionales bacterium]|nr:NAD-dependent epimerase/dehydratase family protein [Bdellovibrionales bacterium]
MKDLSDKKILITGGIGFVASHILDLLVQEDVEKIILVDNFVRGSKKNIQHHLTNKKVELIEADIKNINIVNTLMKDIDYCFHMAAIRINLCASDHLEAFKTLGEGSFNVAQACMKQGVKKLIAASTASVYGTADDFPTDELHHPYNNRTFYGALKMFNELMYRSFNETNELDYIALRFFNLYGPRMDTDGKYTEVLIKWYKLIKEGKRPLIFGDGKQTMDFVNVLDVAKSCICAMNSDVQDEVFNIASGIEISLEELCLELIKAMKVDIKPEYIPVPEERRKVEVTRRKASIVKAKKLLGFENSIPIEEGMKQLVNWLDSLDTQEVEKL